MASGCMGRGGITNTGWTVVSAQDNIVYAALASGQVAALDAAKNGETLWTYPHNQDSSGGPACSIAGGAGNSGPAPLNAVYGIPVVTDDLLLVTSFDNHLYVFDRNSGDKLWDYAAKDAVIGGVTLYDGVAYFGSSDHHLYAVSLETKALVWSAPFATEERVWGAPAVDERRVYIGSMDHNVYAIDRRTGTEVWRKDIGCSVPGSVTLSNGALLVGGVDKRMRALDAATGAELWRTEELAGWVWGEALVHDGAVYFGSLGGSVYGLSLADGTPRWAPVQVQGAVRAGPALQGTQIIVGTDAGRLYSISIATGTADVLSDQIAGGVLSRPAVDGDMIYVGSTAGNVYALDVNLRNPVVWVYPPSSK
jgi:outer membrane protein assembly factor BamB